MLVALPIERFFPELENINYMMTLSPCCYFEKNTDCFNFTEVSNLSVKGRKIRFGKLFQDDGVGKIKCLALQVRLACGLETLAIYNFVNHGRRL